MKSQDHGRSDDLSGFDCRVLTITSVMNLIFIFSDRNK